ncbi:hypothetical protein N0V90_009543 [Kalmusia sp. IMI 367209]|nr:hypothetical protein N0V90_009543 [Kalmusia sp. IMI 367209]
MGILDLPIELLRPIIQDVVLTCGNCGKARHRDRWDNRDVINLARVNTVFEWEVFLILEKHSFLIRNESRPSSQFDLHPEYAIFVSRYVFLRPYPEGAHWNDHFPALINGVVDEIIQLKPRISNTDRVRARYIDILCRKASLHLLVSKRIKDISRRNFKEHLIVAATYIRELSVLVELLCLDTNLSQTYSDYWGYPMKAAVATEDTNLVRSFMLHGATFDHPGWLKDVVRVRNATQLLSIFITQQKLQSVSQTSIRDFANAVIYAVELYKEDVAISLLNTQRDTFGHGSWAYYFRNVLLEACKRGMKELLHLFIEAGAYINGNRWTGVNLRKLITTTCEAGKVGVLQILFEKTKSLKDAIPPSEFILPSAKAGHIEILRFLLDAGGKLDAISAMKLLAHVAPWPPNSDAIWYILNRKAIDLQELLKVEEHVGFGVAHCMMVAAQRGNFELLEALARYGVPLDDHEFYAKAGCPLPIVIAETFGQKRTVGALKELVCAIQLESYGQDQNRKGTKSQEKTVAVLAVPFRNPRRSILNFDDDW